jgi:transposase
MRWRRRVKPARPCIWRAIRLVRARAPLDTAVCSVCGVSSGRVHGYHWRTVADVPADGRRVVVPVRVRRLVCPTRGCRHTFREQVSGVLERYQRRTARLTRQVKAVVKELAGRTGSRLLVILAVGLSRHTALRTRAVHPVAHRVDAPRDRRRRLPARGQPPLAPPVFPAPTPPGTPRPRGGHKTSRCLPQPE